MTGERNDVLNLVDSDDEEIFQDAVPRLPVLPNGHSTTLVEIHRIPSSKSRLLVSHKLIYRHSVNVCICQGYVCKYQARIREHVSIIL